MNKDDSEQFLSDYEYARKDYERRADRIWIPFWLMVGTLPFWIWGAISDTF